METSNNNLEEQLRQIENDLSEIKEILCRFMKEYTVDINSIDKALSNIEMRIICK